MPRRTTSWSSTSITRIGLLSSVAVTAVLPRRRWRDGGAEGCCRSLASGAVMAGASLMHGSSDKSSAPGARLTVAPVDVQRPGEVPAAAVDVHVQLVETGASGLQGPLHHGGGLAQDGVCPALAERRPGRVEAGAGGPQRLVGVDVADAADQVLGQQQGLDGSAAGAQAAGDRRQDRKSTRLNS